MKTTLTPHGINKTVNLLNDALKCDPDAINALIDHRVPCNDALADHPTIQAQANTGGKAVSNGTYVVGLLGILNGIFGVNAQGRGYITAEFDDKGKLTKFYRTPEE